MTFAYRPLVVACLAIGVLLLSVVKLEMARDGITLTETRFGETPVTLYDAPGADAGLVVVAHGFAGSRRMMEAISLTLARAGHSVVAFDFLGHGRHPTSLSPDVTRITGTTQDLVRQTRDVIRAAQALTGAGEVALVGHSMATDVVIRAAEELENVTGVVAISMYSDAVTPQHPARLLIVSGAFENRLRAVARDAVAQVGSATEGVTVAREATVRRAVAAPMVGHVGVLWSPVTAREISTWLGTNGRAVVTGPWIAALLIALILLAWPVSHLLPLAPRQAPPSRGRAILAVVLGAGVAVPASLISFPVLGFGGFGSLLSFLTAYGVTALIVLRWWPASSVAHTSAGALMLVLWGLGVYAVALDRYGASFLPPERLMLAAVLVPATMIFAVADRAVVGTRRLGLRVLLRLPVLVALLGAMLLNQTTLGLLFTVLPVLVLFWLVYGTMALWVARRAGPLGAVIGSGVILAWSIAASTPLFATM